MCPFVRTHRGPKPWHETSALRLFRRDVDTLRFGHPVNGQRRLHATRHSFISQLIDAGASEAIVKRFTHPGSAAADREPFRGYVHYTWPRLCDAISKLPI